MTYMSEESITFNKMLQKRWDMTVPVKSGQIWRHKNKVWTAKIISVDSKWGSSGRKRDIPEFTKPYSLIYINYAEGCEYPAWGLYEDFLNYYELKSDPRVKVCQFWKANIGMKWFYVKVLKASANVTYKLKNGNITSCSNLNFQNAYTLHTDIKHGFIMKVNNYG